MFDPLLRAFILGGTSGLGLELAHECRRRNIRPIIVARSVYDEEVRKKFPPDSLSIPLDLTNQHSIGNLHDHLRGTSVRYFFWVSGIFHEGSLNDTSHKTLHQMIAVHLQGPLDVLKIFQAMQSGPYHLVVIASTSSWRLRYKEAAYCALKASKAAFAINFANELIRERPGSKVTLVHPGGMNTPLWEGVDRDLENFMDPKVVSKIIWNHVANQETKFDEFHIIRNSDGSPRVEYGPKCPEIPVFLASVRPPA